MSPPVRRCCFTSRPREVEEDDEEREEGDYKGEQEARGSNDQLQLLITKGGSA
jgi:hypothetical protein